MNPNTPYKLLIVDDDRDDQYMLKKIFQSVAPAAEIVQLYNGDECLRYLEAHAHDLPSLITMDINMPLVNGIEATAQIKTNPVAAKIPLVILTTSDRNSDKNSAMSSGADDYYIKPVIYEELQAVVKQIVTTWLT